MSVGWIRTRSRKLTSNAVGWALLISGAAILVVGYVYLYGWSSKHIVLEMYANTGITSIYTAIVVLVIDRLNRARVAEAHTVDLIRDMASSDHGLAARASRELRSRNVWTDGTIDAQDFSRAALQDCTLEYLRSSNSRFQGCNLKGSNLSGALLSQSSFNRANLAECNLERAVLRGCSFLETIFERTDMADCDLRFADLEAARLREVDLRGADLRGARLVGADLSTASMAGAKLDEAVIDVHTVLPPDPPRMVELSDGTSVWPAGVVWPG